MNESEYNEFVKDLIADLGYKDAMKIINSTDEQVDEELDAMRDKIFG